MTQVSLIRVVAAEGLDMPVPSTLGVTSATRTELGPREGVCG